MSSFCLVERKFTEFDLGKRGLPLHFYYETELSNVYLAPSTGQRRRATCAMLAKNNVLDFVISHLDLVGGGDVEESVSPDGLPH